MGMVRTVEKLVGAFKHVKGRKTLAVPYKDKRESWSRTKCQRILSREEGGEYTSRLPAQVVTVCNLFTSQGSELSNN